MQKLWGLFLLHQVQSYGPMYGANFYGQDPYGYQGSQMQYPYSYQGGPMHHPNGFSYQGGPIPYPNGFSYQGDPMQYPNGYGYQGGQMQYPYGYQGGYYPGSYGQPNIMAQSEITAQLPKQPVEDAPQAEK